MESFKIKCPHCDSTEIRCVDTILATVDIECFEIVDGQLVPEYSSNGSEVHWDTQSPADEHFPFECSDCGMRLSEANLLAASREEDGDENEDDE